MRIHSADEKPWWANGKWEDTPSSTADPNRSYQEDDRTFGQIYRLILPNQDWKRQVRFLIVSDKVLTRLNMTKDSLEVDKVQVISHFGW